jgi:hypothetical protein
MPNNENIKILVTGDRNYKDTKTIELTFNLLSKICIPTETTFIHGACKGADLLAAAEAEKRNYKIAGEEGKGFPAEWNKYGRAAGPIRNKEMVDMSPNIIIIFHDNLKESKGTKNCVKLILKKDFKPILLLNGIITTKEELSKLI